MRDIIVFDEWVRSRLENLSPLLKEPYVRCMGRTSAKLTAQDGQAETPLHEAGWAGDVEKARRLIAHGADVNHIDSAGETALHGAAAWGHARMVEFLLSAGARFDIPGTTGLTPLHWAAGWGNLETVRVLVQAGADVSARNEFGSTPADVALEHRKSDIAAYLNAGHS